MNERERAGRPAVLVNETDVHALKMARQRNIELAAVQQATFPPLSLFLSFSLSFSLSLSLAFSLCSR